MMSYSFKLHITQVKNIRSLRNLRTVHGATPNVEVLPAGSPFGWHHGDIAWWSLLSSGWGTGVIFFFPPASLSTVISESKAGRWLHSCWPWLQLPLYHSWDTDKLVITGTLTMTHPEKNLRKVAITRLPVKISAMNNFWGKRLRKLVFPTGFLPKNIKIDRAVVLAPVDALEGTHLCTLRLGRRGRLTGFGMDQTLPVPYGGFLSHGGTLKSSKIRWF